MQKLTVKDLVLKKNDKATLIKGLTTEFECGKLNAIMGPNGCGKTTFLNLLFGDSKRQDLTSGSILIDGKERKKEEWFQDVSYVQQKTVLIDKQTVRETLQFGLDIQNNTRATNKKLEDFEHIIKMLHIENVLDSFVSVISGGERKRTIICLELIMMKRVLILDEPTSDLDSHLALKLIVLLKKLAKKLNIFVIFTIHKPSEQVFKQFDNILFMKDGKAVYSGECKKMVEFLSNKTIIKPETWTTTDFIFEAFYNKSRYQEIENCKAGVDIYLKELEILSTAVVAKAKPRHRGSNSDCNTKISFSNAWILIKRFLKITYRNPIVVFFVLLFGSIPFIIIVIEAIIRLLFIKTENQEITQWDIEYSIYTGHSTIYEERLTAERCKFVALLAEAAAIKEQHIGEDEITIDQIIERSDTIKSKQYGEYSILRYFTINTLKYMNIWCNMHYTDSTSFMGFFYLISTINKTQSPNIMKKLGPKEFYEKYKNFKASEKFDNAGFFNLLDNEIALLGLLSESTWKLLINFYALAFQQPGGHDFINKIDATDLLNLNTQINVLFAAKNKDFAPPHMRRAFYFVYNYLILTPVFMCSLKSVMFKLTKQLKNEVQKKMYSTHTLCLSAVLSQTIIYFCTVAVSFILLVITNTYKCIPNSVALIMLCLCTVGSIGHLVFDSIFNNEENDGGLTNIVAIFGDIFKILFKMHHYVHACFVLYKDQLNPMLASIIRCFLMFFSLFDPCVFLIYFIVGCGIEQKLEGDFRWISYTKHENEVVPKSESLSILLNRFFFSGNTYALCNSKLIITYSDYIYMLFYNASFSKYFFLLGFAVSFSVSCGVLAYIFFIMYGSRTVLKV